MARTREIPGTVPIEGREFLYIEYEGTEEFVKLFPEIPFRGPQSGVTPKRGGMLNENVRVALPEGGLFFGVSYKGDVEGWRAVLLEFCAHRALRSAVIDGDALVTSSGHRCALSRCTIDFYEL